MISLENASTLVISDSIFQNNSAEGRGGAMFIASGNLSMQNCDVLENRSGSTLKSEQFQL